MSPQEGQEDHLLGCIAKLSSLLEHALKEFKATNGPLLNPHYSCLLSEPPLYAFSTPLLKALLNEPSSLSSSLDRVLSFTNQQRGRIALALETVSLQCLARYLLNSGAEDGVELALCLLMVRCLSLLVYDRSSNSTLTERTGVPHGVRPRCSAIQCPRVV